MVSESIVQRMTAAEAKPVTAGRVVKSLDLFHFLLIKRLLGMKRDNRGDAVVNAAAAFTEPLLDRRPSSFRTR